MDVVEFDDIELWTTGWLRAALDDPAILVATVDTSSSKTRSRVIVRRDGGPQTSRVTEVARLAVRVSAPTEQAATDLARRVYALLAGTPGAGPVRRFRGMSGPSAVADAAGPMRYLLVELTVRGARLQTT